MKHSQRITLKERDKKNATADDIAKAMKRAQGQLGNFGDATGTFDDLMGNLELGTASALSQSDRPRWRLGAFGEAGLAAPNVEDVYQNLAAAAQKKKANKSAAKPDGSEDDEEDEADDTEEEAENSQGNRNDNQNNTLNDVARNKATRSAQSSVNDLRQQMNLMLTKGRAAVAELEADSDAMRFKAEVAVLNWRLNATRVVMNVEDKDVAGARLQLAETKQQIGLQHPGSSGAQSEEAASSAGTSTAEANAALVKAAPSPSFVQIKLFADFEDMVSKVQASKTKDELKEAQAAMRSAKSHLSSLVSSLQAAIQDAYLARKLHRTRMEGPSKQEEKRRQQVEASMAGEERARKKAKPVEFSIFNADHPDDLDMPMFTIPELREFLTSATNEDVLALFSNPFIMKNVGWLGSPPIAPTPGGAPDSREAAALSPAVPPVQWVANLATELHHFRALFGTSSQKASGGRAALPIKDTDAILQLANLAQGAFPVGWMRTQLQPNLPPDLFEQMAPSFYGLPANTKLISFEKGYLASLRLATSGGTRRVIQSRFTDVGQYVREIKGKETEVPNGTDTFQWLMHEATAESVQDMLAGPRGQGGTPIFWGSVGDGDALYTPAGAVIMDSPAGEDSIGVRIPIIAQWDTIAAQELSACQADWAQRTKTENPMVEKTLHYVQAMGSDSGAQPDRSTLIWPPLAAPALSPNNGGHATPLPEQEGVEGTLPEQEGVEGTTEPLLGVADVEESEPAQVEPNPPDPSRDGSLVGVAHARPRSLSTRTS